MTAHTVLMLLVAYHPTFFTDLSISKPFSVVFTYILDISCFLVLIAGILRFLLRLFFSFFSSFLKAI